MMKSRIAYALTIFLAGATCAVDVSAQKATPGSRRALSAAKFAELAERVRECDEDSIEEAGRTGDQRFIPLLRLGYRDGFRPCSDYRREILTAMAKLEDQEALQTVWCDVVAGDPLETPTTLHYVGGWFAIRTSLRLAEQDTRYFELEKEKERRRSEWAQKNLKPGEVWLGNDVVIQGSPRTWALRLLSMLIPKGPVRYPDDDYEADLNAMDERIERDLRTWRGWIRAHEHELKKRRPTGWNVNYTESACKAVD